MKLGEIVCWVDRGKGEGGVFGVFNKLGNIVRYLSKLDGMGDEVLEYK